MNMKMLLIAIFALSCFQISNAALVESTTWWYPPEYTTTVFTESTTTASTTTESTTTESDSIPELDIYRACSDITGNLPGVYLIQPNNDVEPFEVYCDIVDGKKWTVIQQRFNKSVDFFRDYASYTMGFGPLTGNHWLGLEKIHQLTKNGDHELRVELKSHYVYGGHAQYSTFKVDSVETGFKLTICGYSGNAGDSMCYTCNSGGDLNGMKFSTFDKDQDMSLHNCAEYYQGAWWFNACSYSSLNGPYHDTAVWNGGKSMYWVFNFGMHALKRARMLVKRK